MFRTDAGPDIGLGHLQRSLSLAVSLGRLGTECRFLAKTNVSGKRRISESGFAAHMLPNIEPWSSQDMEHTIEVASENGCSTIVVDSHHVTAGYLASLRAADFFVAVRDDLAVGSFPCQMVFNGNLDANLLSYVSSSGDTIFLLGPEYIALSQLFEEPLVPTKTAGSSIQNVLVILGGADHKMITPNLLRVLDEAPGNFRITAVVGTFYQDLPSLESIVRYAKKSIELISNPPSVYQLMIEADLAISAAGQTLYELACVGCPTIAFSVAPNQRNHLTALEMAGVLRSAGDADSMDVVSNTKAILSELANDTESRMDMASAGRRLIDGKGARRVARRILAETQADGSETRRQSGAAN